MGASQIKESYRRMKEDGEKILKKKCESLRSSEIKYYIVLLN